MNAGKFIYVCVLFKILLDRVPSSLFLFAHVRNGEVGALCATISLLSPWLTEEFTFVEESSMLSK